jgi:DNA-binding IclR family transcriptional regulator
MQSEPAQPNQSVIQGIDVLLTVASRGGPVRVRELARELGYTSTRLQRYLATLGSLGFLVQNTDRSYSVGPGIHALSAISLSASGLAQKAVHVLSEFRKPDCIVALGILWRQTVSYLYFNTPHGDATQSIGRDGGFPAEQSSIGRVLMASLPKSSLQRTFPDLDPETRESLSRISADGYAEILQQNGDLSLAVPVGTPPIAALALSGKIDRREIPNLIKKLNQAAEKLL